MSITERETAELTQYRRYRPKYPSFIFAVHVLGTVAVCCLFVGCLWFFYQNLRSEPVDSIVAAKPKAQQITSTNTLKVDTVPLAKPFAETPGIEAKTDRVQQWDWILEQNDNHYIIQLSSSTNKQQLYESAENFDSEDPIAFFPFRLNREQKVVYGYSVGIYDSLDNAKKAVAGLPQRIQNFGPWIRPIDDLQQQIMSIAPTL